MPVEDPAMAKSVEVGVAESAGFAGCAVEDGVLLSAGAADAPFAKDQSGVQPPDEHNPPPLWQPENPAVSNRMKAPWANGETRMDSMSFENGPEGGRNRPSTSVSIRTDAVLVPEDLPCERGRSGDREPGWDLPRPDFPATGPSGSSQLPLNPGGMPPADSRDKLPADRTGRIIGSAAGRSTSIIRLPP